MPLADFHPAVRDWFSRSFAAPTPAQLQAWAAIRSGGHTLVAAPTGSGKTLAAFLCAIDALVQRASAGQLRNETEVLYISPLKALSNDIQRNLETPLAQIQEHAYNHGLPGDAIRAMVRTGDTPQSERATMKRKPPHILVTTPESVYILLTSDSGRRMLRNVRTVIIDEIHALANSKRGAHLALSLERLAALTGQPLQRIGLSATQKPIEDIARFLSGGALCTIVDAGHSRPRDLALELPRAPLEAVMSGEVWGEVYDRLTELILQHRTTLVFVNQRRAAERVARALSERLGEQFVTSHHGSLSREHRLHAEQRLKTGQLRVLVATASLELGIDIGDVELVCQLGSPRSIATFLQRVGRAGHAVDGTPKGRLFPLSRDDLVESAALLAAVQRGELDRLILPQQPLDVLAQQLVAETACRECGEDELFDLVRRADPYRNLSRPDFDSVVRMLADGYSTQRGRHRAYIHRDAVNKILRARRGAKLTAVTCGGTIPDNGDYDVLLEPANLRVGTVNEDFAIESMAGDIFQLGNTSYRILRIEASTLRVADAHGQPPSIPFWFGEAPGRTDELSAAVARLREEVVGQPRPMDLGVGARFIELAAGAINCAPTNPLPPAATQQLTDYLTAGAVALGTVPSLNTIVLERFFDEAGDMHMVVHSCYGSRVNRAWGLALRKRFCRKFNFELQAAATEDAIILSLGATHSFPLEEAAHYLHAATVRPILIQALLDAPMFKVRWRWNASIALAVPRFRGGKKLPPQLQRMDAEDFVAVVFPDQLACFENIQGEREVPDHPLVNQTIHDCLHEAMDINGLEQLLAGIERGDIKIVARDLLEPSPFAQEILGARPYAFLDDAPLEERRTRAVQSRRWIDPQQAADLGRLDQPAIERVREEAWPSVTNSDELHDALMLLGYLTPAELSAVVNGEELFARLNEQKRVTTLTPSPCNGEGRGGDDQISHDTCELSCDILTHPHPNPPPCRGREPDFETPPNKDSALLVAAERLPQLLAVFPDAQLDPLITAPEDYARSWERADALRELVRGRIEGLGPVTALQLARSLGVTLSDIDLALLALEAEGFVMRGQFTSETTDVEWCERRLLARIHRYTLNRLRAEIEPVSAQDFMRFLLHWQRVTLEQHGEGPQALAGVLAQLEGYSAPAGAWESEVLPARINDYVPDDLDALCLAGRVVWVRLNSPAAASAPVKSTPIALLPRKHVGMWMQRTPEKALNLSPRARKIAELLAQRGACFFDDLLRASGLLRTQLEETLAELVAQGAVNSDSFSGLRALLTPQEKRRSAHSGRRAPRGVSTDIEDAGRWTLTSNNNEPDMSAPHPGLPPAGGKEQEFSPIPRGAVIENGDRLEHIARALLRRYGVVFRKLLERESELPPWRDLLMVYRRMEARGELRGGRFVAGFSGEQYALAEAIGALREVRRQATTGQTLSISAADPLNLAGIITPGARIPAITSNRVLYRDGIPIAVQVGGETVFLEAVDPHAEWNARLVLLRRRIAPGVRSTPDRN
ncbi:MAG: DEAD/DEAH box helicase [Gammaproteobacteria bacterium]|nr:DEAD/DEAH box helicase [Gammaproteobacteria bacterium]